MCSEFAVNRPVRGWFIDSVQVDPAGIIRIVGWSDNAFKSKYAPAVYLNGELLSLLQDFRYPRPDVAARGQPSHNLQNGLLLEYVVPEHLLGRQAELSIDFGNGRETSGPYTFLNPHYRSLFDSAEVLHRDHIYGSGLPNASVHPEVLSLAAQLTGPMLDFGCGRGALIAPLRELGLDVRGLEMDSELLKEFISPDLRNFITFYNGEFPVPFDDAQFKSVVCSEVLEHIPDYRGAVREIARVTSQTALFTVPDASAIPLGFRHGAVPWHLLEGTHVNFFSQKSLQGVLAPHFRRIEFGRIGAARFNDSPYFVSLVALCSKR